MEKWIKQPSIPLLIINLRRCKSLSYVREYCSRSLLIVYITHSAHSIKQAREIVDECPAEDEHDSVFVRLDVNEIGELSVEQLHSELSEIAIEEGLPIMDIFVSIVLLIYRLNYNGVSNGIFYTNAGLDICCTIHWGRCWW